MNSRIQNLTRLTTYANTSVVILAITHYDTNVLILGKFQGNLDLGNTIVEKSNNPAIFLASYNNSELDWFKKIAEVDSNTDTSGSLLIVGSDTYIGFEFEKYTILFDGTKISNSINSQNCKTSNSNSTNCKTQNCKNQNSNSTNCKTPISQNSNSTKSVNSTKSYLVIALDNNLNKIYSFVSSGITDVHLTGYYVNSTRSTTDYLVGRSANSYVSSKFTSSDLILVANFNKKAVISNTTITSEGHDFIIAKFNTYGVLTKLKQVDLGNAIITGVKIYNNKLVIVGNFLTSMSIDGLTLNEDNNYVNSFWSRSNFNLDFLELRSFESVNNNFNNHLKNSLTANQLGPHLTVTDLEIDKNGNRYMTGRINGNYKFGSSYVKTTGDTLFLVKIDRFDIFLFIKLIDYDFKLDRNILNPNLVTDGTHIYLSSPFHYTVRFVKPTMNDPLNQHEDITITSDSSLPVFVVKYSSDGNLLWVETLSTTELHKRKRLCCNNKNEVYVFGNSHLTSTKMTSYFARLLN